MNKQRPGTPTTSTHAAPHPTLRWCGDTDGTLKLIDQTRLPMETVEIDCVCVEDVWQAIRRLSVRGAPAIGVSAAYGVVLGVQQSTLKTRADFDARLDEVIDYLASSRPTAVNLFWALERMRSVASGAPRAGVAEVHQLLLTAAQQIELEDRQMCHDIGQHGAQLLEGVHGVLTHCNAGGLATAGEGTALSVIFAAAAANPELHVYADETRPLLQGARLTSWELQQRDISVTVICDSAAGWVMQQGRVQAIVTGADRIAANGDTANKIGTYSVAMLARSHNIPFYVAAPSSTFDLSLSSGTDIPLEQRPPEEICQGFGLQTVPSGVDVFNPAFDVTPADLIQALITERGLIQPVNADSIQSVLAPAQI
ncbi:MAG: S-methyl-5-thioribose-1-phosphate isomerase [Planctomycetaceae bacterium]